jgi:hypothetical protein
LGQELPFEEEECGIARCHGERGRDQGGRFLEPLAPNEVEESEKLERPARGGLEGEALTQRGTGFPGDVIGNGIDPRGRVSDENLRVAREPRSARRAELDSLLDPELRFLRVTLLEGQKAERLSGGTELGIEPNRLFETGARSIESRIGQEERSPALVHLRQRERPCHRRRAVRRRELHLDRSPSASKDVLGESALDLAGWKSERAR